MTLAEALETTRIPRGAGCTGGRTALVTTRPFRAPQYTISNVGLIGGGHVPMPGEVSLAHHGILFLDELPEFRRHVLKVLRQPLEEVMVTIAHVLVLMTVPVCRNLATAPDASRQHRVSNTSSCGRRIPQWGYVRLRVSAFDEYFVNLFPLLIR
jgi:magnesium chelatase family protein